MKDNSIYEKWSIRLDTWMRKSGEPYIYKSESKWNHKFFTNKVEKENK